MKYFIFFLLVNSIPIGTLGIEKNIFLSTKYNEVNLRNGPGTNHIINLKFLKKGIPLKVIDKYESWYRIIDYSGEKGWISKNQLSKNRYGIVKKSQVEVKIFPNQNSKIKAILYKNIVFRILKCKLRWCKINVEGNNAWIKKDNFWGVQKEELF
ncbi:MAG: hypothetical protein CBE14_001000 [Rickettsiales bacterium TMED254]|nr:hypothetical protein [Rickettsiales bacterium]RPF77522.1 MAG: hypothetical protein CBE14_001000 [Rickettsiales bacterium TMED254]